MLLEFSVANFRSIKEKQTLSLLANKGGEMLEQNSFAIDDSPKSPRLLRSAVIYGPNAGGKSSLIQAHIALKQLVLRSHRHQVGDKLDVTPFKLSEQTRAADTEFELHFIEQGVRYQYNLNCNVNRISHESLLAYPNGRAQKWFQRTWNAEVQNYSYEFGANLQQAGKCREWAQQTLENTLFLSKSVQNNHEQLRVPFSWVQKRLRLLSEIPNKQFTLKTGLDETALAEISKFMSAADLGIEGVAIEKRPFSGEHLPKKLPAEIRERLEKEATGSHVLEPKFIHKNTDSGESIEFGEDEESDGTRALFALAGPWFDVLSNNLILVIDELDTSLHPLLVQHLVKQLHAQNSQAQLIFTTHDTSLLGSSILRPDQVWFVEKNQSQATELYSLADFSPRKGEAIERGYFKGRFGGVPLLKTKSLLSDD